ncbi:MAG: UDP-N-acetylglucosamine 2-epimerase [Actinomycetota bacterium]|nr:UDP-N-acetylglucosamine 2-epimerase [Actinomycetota bacterium]
MGDAAVPADAPMIHVFIGTKAQYIKTAPLLRLMDAEGVDYRLIDSGQHADLSRDLRVELGIREPDVVLASGGDIDSIGQAVMWSGRLSGRLASSSRLTSEVFGGLGGICVVHGDTPSTLIAALMARRAGLDVAHLEAGLRSHNYTQPFPEELIRIATMRLSRYLFAPDDAAMANLEAMGLLDRATPTLANSSVEALAFAVSETPVGSTGPAVATMHRVENLKRKERVNGFVDLLLEIASTYPVLLVLHGPTKPTLKKSGALAALTEAGVETTDLMAHNEFTKALAAAPLVVTDGGSIQEECALLGVPTLLWRGKSERPDGLGANVVLSNYRRDVTRNFLADPEAFRHEPLGLDADPSRIVLDTLLSAR